MFRKSNVNNSLIFSSFVTRNLLIFIKSLKNKKKNLAALTSFYYVIREIWTNQDSTLSHTRDNSKMFNIPSKYFSLFNNKPPAS